MADAAVLSPDLLPEHVQPLLGTRWLGRLYEPLAVCSSTNDEAARRALEGAPAGLLVAADCQSGGRGRLGRSWQSAPGENLTFSLLLRPDVAAVSLPPLTLVAGAAVAGALAGLGIDGRLKWPNDLLVDGPAGPRKLVGILTEMATVRDRVRHVVLGIGVNVNQSTFAPDLSAIATSLRLVTGREHDRGQVLAALLDRLEPALDAALAGDVESSLAEWRHHARLPRACRIQREPQPLEGTALDIAPDGALLVRDADGVVHRVLAGDVV